jgi:transposase
VSAGRDILNLPHVRAVGIEEHKTHYVISAVGAVEPTACPACASPALHRHGTKQQSFMDTPMHGKRVELSFERRRYRCTACGKTMLESLPSMDAKRQMTSRLLAYIEQRCVQSTFAEVSREVGVDDKTIRHVFDDYTARTKEALIFETPRVLGIDELKIVGEYRCMLTNIEANSVFDLLRSRKKVELLSYFRELKDKKNIEIVTMDMWSVYRQVVAAQLPGRFVVVDKVHVVRMANDALERVRKRIRRELASTTRIKMKNERFVLLKRLHDLTDEERGKLQTWCELYPALGAAHEAKESFFAIYDQPDRKSAEDAAHAWEGSLDPLIASEFRETLGALKSWWTEIFNIFDAPVTNAYTESVNRLAKDVNRMGRGYSFDVIRARLLFDQEARKPTKSVVRTKVRRPVPERSDGFVHFFGTLKPSPTRFETVVEEKTIEYGPHLPTLCRLLEEGHFE